MFFDDPDLEELDGVGVGQDGSGGVFGGDTGLDPALGPGDPLGQVGQVTFGPFDAGGPAGGVAGFFGGGVDPDDPIALGGAQRRLEDRQHIGRLAAAAGRHLVGLDAVRTVAADPVPEPGVFSAGAGQHGDEAPAGGVDVVHGGPGAQLGVGHVEEIFAADQRAQVVPGVDVGDVVGDIARYHPMGDGHRAVGADGEDPHQLAQIGPVVLVVTEGDRGGGFAAPGSAVGLAMVAGEGDTGGVVVQLGAVDPKGPHRAQHHLGQKRGPIGVEEPVQAAADAIIVEQARPRRPPDPEAPDRNGRPTR